MQNRLEADPMIATIVQERLASLPQGILSGQGYVLGIDLGCYGLRAALVDLQKQTYTSSATELTQSVPHAVLHDATTLAQDLLREQGVAPNKLVRIAVGFGGPVEPQQGSVRLSPRMSGWENFLLRDHIEQMFDTGTLIENDANLIALGEATFGIGKGYNHLFYLHLSSGVGGGLVLDGRLYQGAAAMAGEIGHAPVMPGWDGNGHPPTLEDLVSITGLLQRANKAGLETADLEDIFSDHPAGQEVVQETVHMLARLLVQVSALLDPQIIVLGGVVVRIGGEPFVEQIAEAMQRYSDPKFARPVKLVASVLGSDSVAIGALALALESLYE